MSSQITVPPLAVEYKTEKFRISEIMEQNFITFSMMTKDIQCITSVWSINSVTWLNRKLMYSVQDVTFHYNYQNSYRLQITLVFR